MSNLDGAVVLVLGRLQGVTHRRLKSVLDAAGARATRRLDPEVTLVTVAHGLARPLMSGHAALDTLERLADTVELLSELSLKRRLGLAPPPAPEPKSMSAAETARLSGLDGDLLYWLGLFDVLEPVDRHYGYRDLVGAREVARLLRDGADLAEIVEAAILLRRRGVRLSEARLTETPAGRIARRIDGLVAGLDGQLRLPLGDAAESAEEVFEQAEDAEMEGDLAGAERLLRRAAFMDRSDPVAPFNLGNVLDAQGRRVEAAFAWQEALNREPRFAEAWFNLALAYDNDERADDAVRHYRHALAANPDYADAAYNLGLLLAETRSHAEALPWLELFLDLEPRAKEAPAARRLAAECRLALRIRGEVRVPAGTERPRPRRR